MADKNLVSYRLGKGSSMLMKLALEVYRLNGSYRGEITAWPKQPGLTRVTRGYPISTWLDLAAIALLGLLLYLRRRRSHRREGGHKGRQGRPERPVFDDPDENPEHGRDPH